MAIELMAPMETFGRWLFLFRILNCIYLAELCDEGNSEAKELLEE